MMASHRDNSLPLSKEERREGRVLWRWIGLIVLAFWVFGWTLSPACIVSPPNLECRPCLPDSGRSLLTFICDLNEGVYRPTNTAEYAICERNASEPVQESTGIGESGEPNDGGTEKTPE